jgi:xylose isomerase
MINDGRLKGVTDNRYAGWKQELGQNIMNGKSSLEDLSKLVLDKNIEPKHKSGRQEFLENVVNRYL